MWDCGVGSEAESCSGEKEKKIGVLAGSRSTGARAFLMGGWGMEG